MNKTATANWQSHCKRLGCWKRQWRRTAESSSLACTRPVPTPVHFWLSSPCVVLISYSPSRCAGLYTIYHKPGSRRCSLPPRPGHVEKNSTLYPLECMLFSNHHLKFLWLKNTNFIIIIIIHFVDAIFRSYIFGVESKERNLLNIHFLLLITLNKCSLNLRL